MRKKLLSILALLLMTATGAWADFTVTWTADDMKAPGIYIHFGYSYAENNIIKGITVTASGEGEGSWDKTNINLNSGSPTIKFASSVGNIKSIEITSENWIQMSSTSSGWTLDEYYDEYSDEYYYKLSWSGEASTTVSLDLPSWTQINGISEIVFTIEPPTVTLTDGNDLSPLLTYAGKTVDVTYKRTFTEGKPSTVCLPFAYAPKTGQKFYTFTGITLEGNEYVATMTEYTGTTLEANTPYLYKAATTGDTDFSGTYTIPADIKAGTTPSGDWTFVGNYAVTTWASAPTGIYGFSGKDYDEQGISQGQFVQVGSNVSIAPMRCYLKYKNGAENYAGAPQLGRRAGIELPQSIRVRLVNANGEVTSIGEEISVKREDAAAAGWYMLDGRKLSAMPTQKGIYIVNGKKVLIK